MRYALILFAMLLVPSAACDGLHDDPPIDATIRVGESVALAVGETAVVEEADIRITFESVLSDNRCPTDALCVVAGDAKVRLRASGRGMSPVGADVALFEHTSLAYGGVEFQLERLDPWPESIGQVIPTYRYRATIGTRAVVRR